MPDLRIHILLYDQRRGGVRGEKAIQKLIFDLTRGKGGGSEGGVYSLRENLNSPLFEGR